MFFGVSGTVTQSLNCHKEDKEGLRWQRMFTMQTGSRGSCKIKRNVFRDSVDEILWCDHSNETYSAVLLHGTICILVFYKMKFGFRLEF